VFPANLKTFPALRAVRFIAGLVPAWILVLHAAWAQQTPQDTVTRDPVNGDWVYTLHNPDNPQEQRVWRYTPRNKIVPSARSVVARTRGGYEYRYAVSNGREAKQHIHYPWLRGFFVVPSSGPGVLYDPAKMSWAEYQRLADQRRKASDKLQEQQVVAPHGWRGVWNTKSQEFTEYGWFPIRKDEPTGIGVAPGSTQAGFVIRRPELPGAAFAKMQGWVMEPFILGGLPETGPIADAVKQMLEEDALWVPVLVPAIAIPEPYDAAELARRLRAHVQNWQKWEFVSAEVLARLNRQFDVLIPALEINNRSSARAALRELASEVRSHHRRLRDIDGEEKDEEGDEDDNARPVPLRGRGVHAPGGGAVDRVAARALLFDLRYLLKRLDARD
jgi:hypothetical protein